VDRREVLKAFEMQGAIMPNRLVLAIAILLGFVVAVPAATTIKVVQHGLALNPDSATIARGDRMIFTNDDDVIHNIHIFGPGGEDDSEDLGLQKPGKTLSYKFDKVGAYRVRCNIHPSVKMSVQVK
jgi:cytochrome c peroxidase